MSYFGDTKFYGIGGMYGCVCICVATLRREWVTTELENRT